jgi:restriction system protein
MLRAVTQQRPRLDPPKRSAATAPAAVPTPVIALPSLTAAEFEHRVTRLLHEFGFHSLQQIGQPGRPGIDLIARDQQNRLYLVECRQFATGNRVSSADVKRLVEAVEHEQAAGGIFVTTGSFTQAAINLAQYSRVPILLYDGRALARQPAPVAWPVTIHQANAPYARAMARR